MRRKCAVVSDAAALVASILDNPSDETPCRVFRDFLNDYHESNPLVAPYSAWIDGNGFPEEYLKELCNCSYLPVLTDHGVSFFRMRNFGINDQYIGRDIDRTQTGWRSRIGSLTPRGRHRMKRLKAPEVAQIVLDTDGMKGMILTAISARVFRPENKGISMSFS